MKWKPEITKEGALKKIGELNNDHRFAGSRIVIDDSDQKLYAVIGMKELYEEICGTPIREINDRLAKDVVELKDEKEKLREELSNLKKRIKGMYNQYKGIFHCVCGDNKELSLMSQALIVDLISLVEPKKEELKHGMVYGHSPEGWIVKTEDGGVYLVNFPKPIAQVNV